MNAVADAIVAAGALSRREFLRRLQAMGGLLLVADGLHIVKAADAPKYGAEGMEHGTIDNPQVFVMVGDDGWVTIIAHRSEMGQGVRTGMPLIVADEMEADWNRVRVQQAPADEVKYGNQDTDGSRSTRHFIDPMRRCGAAARMMLEQAAALSWNVPAAEVHAVNHEVLHDKTGRKLGFGTLAKRAAKLKVPPSKALRLKKAEEFRYVGKGKVPLIDGHDIVTGQAQYGIDPWFKDMSFAVIARSPVLGGTVKQFDGKAAAAALGVLKVMQMPAPVAKATFHPLAGVAVIANSTGAAIAARKLLKIDWDDGANGSYDSDAYRAALQESAHKPGKVVRESGNIDTALKAAAKTMEAEYYIPHIAHATMEPPCAVARIVAGKCEVWAPTQAPQATREDVAKYLGISEDNVTVHVTLLGGGFGRKSKPDFATEAALLSQALEGRPVKVTWTREDDLHHDYLHTVSVEYLKAGMDANGKVSAWLHRSVAPSLVTLFNPKADHEGGGELGMGFINMPYDIPNLRMENPAASAHCRIGWFRSVSNIPHAFAVQSFVAELAASANKDHRDYLLELVGPARKIDPNSLQDTWNHGESPQRYPVDTGRLRGVIEKVTQEAGWGKKFARGHGQGLAAHYSFVSYAAAVVEVDIDDLGRISVPRIDVAFDCGPQVNPERIRSQLEGAAIMGLSLAMFGEITFKNGRAQQDNFHQYRVMRMNEAPSDIRVHLIPYADWTMPLGGVGEPGIPPIAPALCNAIFAATGKRIRRLPIKDQARRST
jgi:isoquinoline 1-oxidoreductase beta subunit